MIELTNQQKKYIIILMTLMMLLCVSSSDIYISSLPEMVREFHTTSAIINLTVSISSLGTALAVLFVGELSNRFGRKKALLFGTLSFSISGFLISAIPSIDLIIVLRFIQAIGCAVIVVVTRLVLKDSMNEQEQINANGYLLTALVISPALAPVVGAFIAHYLGWRSCFVFSSICGLILTYYTHKILPETNMSILVKFKPLSYYFKIYINLITDRSFLVLTTIYSSAIGAYFTFIGISSYLYIDYWHLSPIEYSYIFICLALAYLMGNKLMRYLNKRKLEPTKIISYGVYSTFLGACILAISLILFSDNLLILMVTMSVLFMRAANAIINPPNQIRIMNIYSHYSAQALGLNMCIGFSVNSFATSIVTMTGLNPLHSLVLISSLFIIICFATYQLNKNYI